MAYVLQPSLLLFNSLGPTLDPVVFVDSDPIEATMSKEIIPYTKRSFTVEEGGTGTGIIVPTTGQLWPLGDLM
jgi:hypothetical protein